MANPPRGEAASDGAPPSPSPAEFVRLLLRLPMEPSRRRACRDLCRLMVKRLREKMEEM